MLILQALHIILKVKRDDDYASVKQMPLFFEFYISYASTSYITHLTSNIDWHISSCYCLMNSFVLKATLLFCLPLCLFSCSEKTKTPDLSSLILSLKETGELVTVQYTLSKVIRASDDQTWYKIGDRKILINCEANVKAGVNLQGITKENFSRENDSTISITLPHAQFFSLSIPPEKIQVAYQETGLFRDAFSANEREQLVAQAEPQIRSLVDSLGILQTAETNADVFVKHLFQSAGFKIISITHQ